jgi:hypothetical protein
MKVKLLTVLGQQLAEKKAVMKILLKVGDSFGQLDLIVEPVQQKLSHRCYKNVKLTNNFKNGG